eukprot:COSAG01_NODE_3285_length_6309_cov_2.105153_2_plen_75_part_00
MVQHLVLVASSEIEYLDVAREWGLTCAAVPARMPGARVQVGRREEERCETPWCALGPSFRKPCNRFYGIIDYTS